MDLPYSLRCQMLIERAHSFGGPSGADVEMMTFGIGLLVLAFLFRPSQVGGRRGPLIVTLLLGAALVAGSFLVPRL